MEGVGRNRHLAWLHRPSALSGRKLYTRLPQHIPLDDCAMNPTSKRLPVGMSHILKAGLIRRAKNQCQGCGYKFSSYLHPHQLARQSGAFELDHKVPISRGGSNQASNLQVLCLPCHDGKSDGNFTDAEWRAKGKPQDWTRKRNLIRNKEIHNRERGQSNI